MAWIEGNQKTIVYKDINEELLSLADELDDNLAKITLAKFLRHNIAFTLEMLGGVRLMELQEIIIRGLLLKDNGLIVAGRGTSKSYLISIVSILYAILYPESKICLISSNFRSARRILTNSEKIINNPKAGMLKACFAGPLRRGNDMYIWSLNNGSEIFALPLSNGEGLRGTRANVLMIDEGLLISKEIQEFILRPFLTVNQRFQEEADIRKKEDILIRAGQMTEAERMEFPKNKYMVFSSASYEFEYLYEMYQNFLNSIMSPEKNDTKYTPSYFVVRASYEALPNNGMMDMTQIDSAKANGGDNTEYFKREYRALFSKTGDGYFNVKKMHECTVDNGQLPTTQIKGDSNTDYILSIDPSYSASKSSDYFAMSVHMLIPQERKTILVHSYARAGGDLKDHYEYLVYLLKYFNIVFAVIDDSGAEFLHGFNESALAKNNNLKLSFLDVRFGEDDHIQEVSKAKSQYNRASGRIVYGAKAQSENIRRMNEHLQNAIDSKKVWFASSVASNEAAFKKYEGIELPFKFKNNN